jgi:hypothetical protein
MVDIEEIFIKVKILVATLSGIRTRVTLVAAGLVGRRQYVLPLAGRAGQVAGVTFSGSPQSGTFTGEAHAVNQPTVFVVRVHTAESRRFFINVNNELPIHTHFHRPCAAYHRPNQS